MPGESRIESGLAHRARRLRNRGGQLPRAAYGFVEMAWLARERVQLEVEQHHTRRAAVEIRLRRVAHGVARNRGPAAPARRVDADRADPVLGAQRGVEIRPVRVAVLDRAAPLGQQRARQGESAQRGARAQRRVQQFATAQPGHGMIVHCPAAARHSGRRTGPQPARGTDRRSRTSGGQSGPRISPTGGTFVHLMA